MKPASYKAAALLVPLVFASAAASAQSLQRVTVTAFTLSTSTTRPRAGTPFQVVVTLRLREPVVQVENVQLPLLAALQVLGDVRTTATIQGTLYREIVTVAARSGGRLTIPPATFEALDARTGRALIYSTNSVTLDVAGEGAPAHAATIVAEVLVSLGIALMVLGVVLGITLRRKPAAAPPAAPPAPEPVPVPADSISAALSALDGDATREAALRARAIVWRMVGADDGETLADVTPRALARYSTLLPALAALERAAFTTDADLPAAVDAARSALRSAQ